MFSRQPPSWSHLPEEPLAPVPEPPLHLRVAFWLRLHGFKFVLVATVVVVGLVFREFYHLNQASDAAAQEQAARSRIAPATTPAAASEYAALSVTTFPSEADVYLDGDLIGQTPISRVRLAPGTYQVSVQKAAHARVDTTLEVNAAQLISMVLPLGPAPVERPVPLPQVAESTPPSRPPARTPARLAPSPSTVVPIQRSDSSNPPSTRSTPSTDPVAMGRLQLRSTPSGADVLIGGRRVGQTPLTLDLEPGEYVATLRKEGYESPTTIFTVQAGQTRLIEPELNALLSTVQILAKPWGTIYLNGELVEDATNVRVSRQVTPGPVRITVVHPLLGRWERVVEVQPGKSVSFVVDFNEQGDEDS